MKKDPKKQSKHLSIQQICLKSNKTFIAKIFWEFFSESSFPLIEKCEQSVPVRLSAQLHGSHVGMFWLAT